MTFDEIMQKQQEILQEVFENNELIVTPQTNADDIDEWDSMTHLTLVMEIENAFGVRFALGELAELKNVGDMAHLIEEKIK